MNAWERRSQLREERYQQQQRRKTPSFSSSLLDAIYRSIDDSECEVTDRKPLSRDTTATRLKKQRSSVSKRNFIFEDEESLRRAIMIEKWMEEEENRTRISRRSGPYNSTSSSSDSSCGCAFSSSEAESGYRERSKSANFTMLKPAQLQSELDQTPKRDGRLTRTKSKALKIYGDLKKVKQPISPGRRLTNFLNSLFNSKNGKNAKREVVDDSTFSSSLRKSSSVKDTTSCSLSSSFSRSCLSKPPPSRGKSKRSVRFYPVPIIYEDDPPSLIPTPVGGKIAESKLMQNELKIKNEAYLQEFEVENENDDEEEEEEDNMSCSSSDLFELENIGAIGVGGAAYIEDLPVYGTTSLRANLAIANGLI